VCADKFRAQPDAAAKTIALSKEVYSWNRAKDFPKELITLPGETDPNSALVDALLHAVDGTEVCCAQLR
jgi:hypothetical protein